LFFPLCYFEFSFVIPCLPAGRFVVNLTVFYHKGNQRIAPRISKVFLKSFQVKDMYILTYTKDIVTNQ